MIYVAVQVDNKYIPTSCFPFFIRNAGVSGKNMNTTMNKHGMHMRIIGEVR